MEKKKPAGQSQEKRYSKVDGFLKDLRENDLDMQNRIKFKAMLAAFSADEKSDLKRKADNYPDKQREGLKKKLDELLG
ncbi:hypothetical protein JW890_00335 [candidate division WOR-3 bacterium]|nr:hypothetical protein [candidate division WOR-3 bacterium]